MVADQRFAEARGYLRARGRLTLAVVAILGAVMAVGLAFILPRFAPGYASVAALFPLMVLAPLFDVAYMANHTELMGLKITRPMASYTLISIAAFVASGVLGARLLGLWGLAGAYVLAYAIQWLLAGRVVRKVRRGSAEFAPDPTGALGIENESVRD
jgi:O-antigen/teichoic acid export membrane protein